MLMELSYYSIGAIELSFCQESIVFEADGLDFDLGGDKNGAKESEEASLCCEIEEERESKTFFLGIRKSIIEFAKFYLR